MHKICAFPNCISSLIATSIKFDVSKLNYLKKENYHEGRIDPNNGCDWNQTFIINEKPKLEDIKDSIKKTLSTELVSNTENISAFAKTFPNIHCVVIYSRKTLHESWNEIIEDLEKIKNVEFQIQD